jgi:hypothetical protein
MKLTLPTNNQFQDVLNNLVDQVASEEKICWWLTGGHSAERWFQFELARLLDHTLGEGYVTCCEVNRCDIVVRPMPSGVEGAWSSNGTDLAKFELKVRGSWHCEPNYTFGDVAKDISKVEGYKVPSMVLLIWVLAYPTEENARCQWITDQNTNCPDFRDEAILKTAMAKHLPKMQQIAKCKPHTSNLFEFLELQLWGYKNIPG